MKRRWALTADDFLLSVTGQGEYWRDSPLFYRSPVAAKQSENAANSESDSRATALRNHEIPAASIAKFGVCAQLDRPST
jgi:hypothetical protein